MLIFSILLGILAGYIASRIRGGQGNGCLIDLILGVIGSFVGAEIFNFFGKNVQGYGCLGQLVVAVIGAVVVLWLYSLITGKKK